MPGGYWCWLDRLEELLGFSGDSPGTYRWQCGDRETGDRLAKARQAALDLGFSPEDMLGLARLAGGHACCDCEISLNCDDRPRPGDEPEPGTASPAAREYLPPDVMIIVAGGGLSGTERDQVREYIRLTGRLPEPVPGNGKVFTAFSGPVPSGAVWREPHKPASG